MSAIRLLWRMTFPSDNLHHLYHSRLRSSFLNEMLATSRYHNLTRGKSTTVFLNTTQRVLSLRLHAFRMGSRTEERWLTLLKRLQVVPYYDTCRGTLHSTVAACFRMPNVLTCFKFESRVTPDQPKPDEAFTTLTSRFQAEKMAQSQMTAGSNHGNEPRRERKITKTVPDQVNLFLFYGSQKRYYNLGSSALFVISILVNMRGPN